MRLLACWVSVLIGAVWAGVPAQAGTVYQNMVLADGPRFYWTFDEADGESAIEQVGRLPADSLIPTQNTTYRDGLPRRSASAYPILGRAADFSQNTGNFSARDPSPTTAVSGSYAIEFWCKFNKLRTTGPTNQYVMMFTPDGSTLHQPAVLFDYNPTHANTLELISGPRTSGFTINDTDWHHVVLGVYHDGETTQSVVAYLDAEKATAFSRQAFNSKLQWQGKLVVGDSTGGGPANFNGLIDELALYDLSSLLTEQAVFDRVGQLAGHFTFAAAIPEPCTLILLSSAAAVLIAWRWWKRFMICDL